MKTFDKVLAVVMVVLLLAVAITFGLIRSVRAATTAVDLGTAASYGVLAGDSVGNTGATTVDWDLGLYPGTSVDGGITVTGTRNVANPAALAAKNDLRTAYLDAFGRTGYSLIANGDLGGRTLTPGVYRDGGDPASLKITGTLYLDAQGDPDAVWIFQSASTLTAEVGSQVVLLNDAAPCNVFWQVGSSAILNTGSAFVGTILANTSITVQNSVTVDGRLLAGAQENGAGAVTLDANTITRAPCAAAPIISVVKVPTPLALSNGPGSVTYDYTVTNIGTVPITNVTVIDDKCATVDFISGDTNSDSKLDPDETWHYRCTTTLSQTTTNTVTVTGQANGFTATDTASATVVVTSPNGVTSPRLPYTGK